MAAIDQYYADMQEHVARMQEEGNWPMEYYHLRLKQNLCGSGQHCEDIAMYYTESEETDCGDTIKRILTFAKVDYNFAAREFHEEFLFDIDGNLIYIHAINPDIKFGENYDFRLYFNKGRLIQATIRRQPDEGTSSSEIYQGKLLPEEYTETYLNYITAAAKYQKLFHDVDKATKK